MVPQHSPQSRPAGRRLWPGTVRALSCPQRNPAARLRRTADGFTIAATAPDGIIEAIERPAAPFCIAVQWHPENFWRTGEFRSLFEEFVKAAESR